MPAAYVRKVTDNRLVMTSRALSRSPGRRRHVSPRPCPGAGVFWKMSLARIKRIAAAAEAAGHAVIADPAKPELHDQLFHALAEVVGPSFAPAGDHPTEMASLTRQARVWAQIVRERIVFTRRFSGTPAARAASDSIGLAHNISELLGVLDSIRQAATADD